MCMWCSDARMASSNAPETRKSERSSSGVVKKLLTCRAHRIGYVGACPYASVYRGFG